MIISNQQKWAGRKQNESVDILPAERRPVDWLFCYTYTRQFCTPS